MQFCPVCADEEQPQSPPHDFESDLDRGRQQKILEDKTFKVIKLGGGEEPPAEPYNCTTNPAPWWHQITVSAAGHATCVRTIHEHSMHIMRQPGI